MRIPALRKLARDVAERELPRTPPTGTRPRNSPSPPRGARQADLFTVTIGEQYGGMGMGDIEAAIVLEELARADVSSAILCQLVFNGPPRAIEHLGNETSTRWLPLAAPASCSASGSLSPTPALRPPRCGPSSSKMATAGGSTPYKNYVTGGHRAVACLVWCRFPVASPAPARESGRWSWTSPPTV